MLDNITFWSAVILDIFLGALGYLSSPRILIYEILQKLSCMHSALKNENYDLLRIFSHSHMACAMVEYVRSALYGLYFVSSGRHQTTTFVVDDNTSTISSHLNALGRELNNIALVHAQSRETLIFHLRHNQDNSQGNTAEEEGDSLKLSSLQRFSVGRKKLLISSAGQFDLGTLVAQCLQADECTIPLIYTGNSHLMSIETAEQICAKLGKKEHYKFMTTHTCTTKSKSLPESFSSEAEENPLSSKRPSLVPRMLTTSSLMKSVNASNLPMVYIPLCAFLLATSDLDVEDSFPLVLACDDMMVGYEVAAKLGFSPTNVSVLSDISQLEIMTALFMAYSFAFGLVSQDQDDPMEVRDTLAALFAEWKRVALCSGVSPVLFRLLGQENQWCDTALYHLCSPFSLFMRGVETAHDKDQKEGSWIMGKEGRQFLAQVRVILDATPCNSKYLKAIEPLVELSC